MNHTPEEDAAELAEALAALAQAEETLRRLAVRFFDKFNRAEREAHSPPILVRCPTLSPLKGAAALLASNLRSNYFASTNC